MKIERATPVPAVKVKLKGKEAKNILKELNFVNDNIILPEELSEFMAQLEEAIGDYC